MTIERNGIEYKLTSVELARAWAEQQLENDIEDVEYMMDEENDADRKIMRNRLLMVRIAKQYRHYLDNQADGDTRYQCWQDAMEYVLNREDDRE